MNDTFMKEKPIFPLLTSMALPMVISMLVSSLYNIVDSLFVARISEEAMTALSLVYPVQNLINAIAIGFSIGISSMISLHLGAGNRDRADTAATLGMAMSILHGIIASIVSIAIMPSFLARFTTDETVIAMGVTYSRVAFMFAVIIMAAMSFEKIFQAVGRMKITMIGLMAGSVCNIILDPLLIFGIGPFPEMGIAGAALATGIGQLVPVVFYIIVYFVSPIPVKLRRSCLRPDGKMALQLYSIGVPAALNLALPSVLITFLNSLLASFSQSYVVVLGIYYKLQTFLYLPANGIVQGLRPVIGYNYGAREYDRVRKIYRTAMGMCAAIMVAGTVLCLALSGQLIGLFSSNAETIAIGTTALRIICIGFIVSTISVVVSGSLEGLGMGVQSLIISLCRYVVIIMPLAWLFCHFIGSDGIWNAFWVTEFITAGISLVVYHKSVKMA
ncbi:MATE family efflux transporter [Gemmiger formicilis]|uniref:MATE family efflux transporter n=1 Tax=Gemmiger formicilis TaxID=745368 RepID=UPI00210B1968|nr:MATE family efflux transporter [Gemmiger formicilis]MCQ5115023.1 MATE family efflux transporter [Gemmiger formicilis]